MLRFELINDASTLKNFLRGISGLCLQIGPVLEASEEKVLHSCCIASGLQCTPGAWGE